MNGDKARRSVHNAHDKSNLTRAQRRKKRQRARRIKLIAGACAAVLLAALLLYLVMRPAAENNDNTAAPTAAVTAEPTAEPTIEPTAEPTAAPTPEPSPEPEPAVDLSAFYEGGVRLTGDNTAEILPYQIYVSKDTFTTAILGIDENGEYTRLLRTWRTAIGTGNKTRAGSYKIDKKYLWYDWSLGGFTPYTSRLEGSKIRLHAPLHNKKEDWNSLWKEGYTQIGSKETQGCLRTTTEGAAWVYFNCTVGTEVIIANDSLYESAEPPELGDSSSDPTRPVVVEDLEIPVTFFTVDSEALSLAAGASHKLTIGGILPDYEEITHTFTFISGDENIAGVDTEGNITAAAPGTCQILVIADDINKAYRIIEVTVAAE